MTTITNTFHLSINAAPEAVFAYVSDLTRHGEWNSGLKIVPLAARPVGVGRQYRTKGEVPGQKERPNELRVTHYQPSTRFAFIAKDPDFKEVIHDFTFKPVSGGTLMERVLNPGEVLRVDTGCIVAFQPSVAYDIQFVGKIKSALFGGEGLFFATLRGPGKIWLQSLPLSRLADRIYAAAPKAGGKGREEGSLLGGLGRILDGDR